MQLGDSKNNAGVFDYYKAVFTDNDANTYRTMMDKAYDLSSGADENHKSTEKAEYYKKVWRTFQMSDHLPMWVELKINFSEEYLKSLISM